jgi:hypothetical protein
MQFPIQKTHKDHLTNYKKNSGNSIQIEIGMNQRKIKRVLTTVLCLFSPLFIWNKKERRAPCFINKHRR